MPRSTGSSRTPAAIIPLAVSSCGDPANPTVAWIHGYTMDSRIWTRVWPLLPGFHHVGIDLPGHGRSAPMTSATTMRQIAVSVAAVLRKYRARRLVALSLGTMVAFEVAIGRLAPLTRLAVVAPALVGMPAAAGTAERYRQLIALRFAGAGRDTLVDTWMSAPPDIFAGLEGHPLARAALRAVIRDHRWDELGFGGPRAFYQDPQPLSDLPGSAERLMVVAGGNDMPEFTGLARRLVAQVPQADLVWQQTAGHLPLLESPQCAIPALAQFLR